jgi:hypothetical protein
MKSYIEKCGLLLMLTLLTYCAAMLTACSSPWPESGEKKQEILAQASSVLRSSIDTNQISSVLAGLKSQTETAFAFREFAKQVISDIDERAALLTDPKLKTDIGEFRSASIPNPYDKTFSFEYVISGPENLVQQIDEFPGSSFAARKLKSSANFYSIGKLRWYKILGTHEEFISFTEEGDFAGCYFWTKEGKNIFVSAPSSTQEAPAKNASAMPEHTTEATNSDSAMYAETIDRLVARLSSDHSWESGGYLAPDWLDVTNSVKQVIPKLLEWDSKVKTSHILCKRNVQIQGSSLPNPYIVALVNTDEGLKAVLLNDARLGTPPYRWYWRVFDEWSLPNYEGKTVKKRVYESK